MPVALQAGVRRAPGGVLVDEALHDRLAELGFHIDGVEGHADQGAGRAGVVHGRDAAAGIGPVLGIVGREEAQVHADHAVAALAHDQRGDRAIDAAAHGDHAGLARAVARPDALRRQQRGNIGKALDGGRGIAREMHALRMRSR